MSESVRWIISGALVGEALGRPFVGMKPGRVEQLLGGERPEGFLASGNIQPERPERNTLPGLHGIAGQRLLAALALGAPDDMGRSPVARVGAELQALADEGGDTEGFGLLRDPGRPVRKAIARWRANYPWEESDYLTIDEESRGAGAALLGFAALRSEDAIGLAERLARLTHAQSVAVAAPVAVSIAARLCIDNAGDRKFDAEGVARRLVEQVAAFEDAYIARHLRAWKEIGWGRPVARLADYLSPLPSLLREGHDELALKTILATAAEHEPEGQRPSHVQHGFAGACVTWALYRGLGNLPPRRAVEDILPRGGECATVAGIVAGLRVALAGVECLPDEWWNGCHGLGVVEALLAKPDFDDWRSKEAQWNAQEDRMRTPLREALKKQAALEEERRRNHPGPSRPASPQEEAPFDLPPHLGLKPGDEEDPKNRKILRALRGKKRIDWKEDRRRGEGEPTE